MANARTITKILREEGFPLELVNNGNYSYFYFIFDRIEDNIWETESVMVPRFSDLSIERWLEIGRSFAKYMIKEIKDRNN